MTADCEPCEFARVDGETGELECDAFLDEDDFAEFLRDGGKCRYYRFYDEYKTVRKQN